MDYSTERGDCQGGAHLVEVIAIQDARSPEEIAEIRRENAQWFETRNRQLAEAHAEMLRKCPPGEYVYRSWMCDEGFSHWSAHRIVKRTAKRVYVELYSHGHPANKYGKTFVLDRENLERDSSAWSYTRGDRFYLKPK